MVPGPRQGAGYVVGGCVAVRQDGVLCVAMAAARLCAGMPAAALPRRSAVENGCVTLAVHDERCGRLRMTGVVALTAGCMG